MQLEDQLCNLEYSKRLARLGVPQESLFYWMLCGDEWKITAKLTKVDELYFTHMRNDFFPLEHYSAFTIAEIGELLPEHCDYHIHTIKNNYEWECRFSEDAEIYKKYRQSFKDNNEANARAKMLIYLIENNLALKQSTSQ